MTLYVIVGLACALASIVTFVFLYFCCLKREEDIDPAEKYKEYDIEELKKIHDKMIRGDSNDQGSAETMLIELEQLTARSMKEQQNQNHKLASIRKKQIIGHINKTYKLDDGGNVADSENGDIRAVTKPGNAPLKRPPSNGSSFNPFEPL